MLGLSATCGAGHIRAPATGKEQGQATGWSEGTGSSTRWFQMAMRKEAVGVFQSPGMLVLACVLSPDTSPNSQAAQHLPDCQGSFGRPGGEGGRMPTWVSTGLCLPGLPGGSRALRLRKLPIWELVTSTREGTVPPGQWLVSAHHPRERQAVSPQAWARLPLPNTYSAGGQGR